MRRIFIEIADDVFDALRARALDARRDVRDEAALLVEAQLGRKRVPSLSPPPPPAAHHANAAAAAAEASGGR